MSPFETYKTYLALKRHFTSAGYDYFKYNGSVPCSEDSYNKRRDKHFFVKLSRHDEPENVILANLVENPKKWIGSFFEGNFVVYKDWLKRNQSLTYTVKESLGKIDVSFNELLACEQPYPLLLRKYINRDIPIEVIVILCAVTQCDKQWDKEYSDDPVYAQYIQLIRKYLPFMSIDEAHMKNVLLDLYS